MAETLASAAAPAEADKDKQRSRFSRRMRAWHRRAVAGTVDHSAILKRAEDDAGWSGRYAFMIAISAGKLSITSAADRSSPMKCPPSPTSLSI